MTIGRYFYDGEGRRVKKVADAETTVFVYSAGKLIAEYSTQLSQSPSVSLENCLQEIRYADRFSNNEILYNV